MLRTFRRPARRAAAALLAALAGCASIPLPVFAQSALKPTLLEPYLSRTRLDPGVIGERARVRGVGARLLYPLPGRADNDRLLVGAFASHAPADGPSPTTSQLGAVAELRLTGRAIGGRVEPLASLGAGAFRARWDAGAGSFARPLCLRPRDVAAAEVGCLTVPSRRPAPVTSPALSPGLGVRVALVPGVALRVDARDHIVFRGRPRHGFELATGVSLMR